MPPPEAPPPFPPLPPFPPALGCPSGVAPPWMVHSPGSPEVLVLKSPPPGPPPPSPPLPPFPPALGCPSGVAPPLPPFPPPPLLTLLAARVQFVSANVPPTLEIAPP